jgi:hypothetical protein
MVSVVEYLSFYKSYRIHRVEKTTSATGNIKWGGVVFAVENKTVTPMFVELSGGINLNNTDKKESDDVAHIPSTIQAKYLNCCSA